MQIGYVAEPGLPGGSWMQPNVTHVISGTKQQATFRSDAEVPPEELLLHLVPTRDEALAEIHDETVEQLVAATAWEFLLLAGAQGRIHQHRAW